MEKKLYIGGLPYGTTQEALASLFSEVGTVESARIITDRETGRSKGFAFVEMSSDTEAQAAVDKFNGQEFEGRRLTVNEARPQPPRDNRGPRQSRY
jgi:RNA recognition motif-containing protein